jgi:cyclase
MFSPRIIPVLLYKGSGLVKSVKFKNFRYIGDPINAVRIFNDFNADELIIIDIEASKKNNQIPLKLVQEVGAEANMPFGVGGGIRTLEQISERLKVGAEKVILNTIVFEDINFVKKASQAFGSSTINVIVDIKRNLFGKYQVYSHHHKRAHQYSYVDYISRVQDAGAGEIIIQSVDRDGTFEGYDLSLYEDIAKKINCPIVALGGAKGVDDIKKLWLKSSVNSFAAGSMFVYYGELKGVLLNYPKVDRNEFRQKFKK